jgi:ubiquinone/menaquinone biosynthesis C-methylase UbiE
MTTQHDDVVRESFRKQVGLFTGDDAVFARRVASPIAWVEPLSPEMIVLDVACGAAHASEQVAPHVRQVVAVDITPALLAAGAERLGAAGVANVLLQEGNANALPFVDASFDLVVCRSSLHHFEDPRRALAEMARVCRPDGRVVVSDMIAPSASVRAAFDEVHQLLDPSHVRALLADELVAAMESTVGPATFVDQTSTTLPIDVIMTDAADRDAVRARLDAEVAGGAPTGFAPAVDAGQTIVQFNGMVVHATPRPAVGPT